MTGKGDAGQQTVYVRVLLRAAELLGGTAELQSYLRVSQTQLERWLKGSETPPPEVFLRAVDLVLVRTVAK